MSSKEYRKPAIGWCSLDGLARLAVDTSTEKSKWETRPKFVQQPVVLPSSRPVCKFISLYFTHPPCQNFGLFVRGSSFPSFSLRTNL
jgi:hypothetical protein